jgi:2-amino-4-hydroxy-6-hydroxymethyldihydropteridine diphosphokinase
VSSPRSSRLGYLSLGSNIGDRRAHLQGAVLALQNQGVALLRSSSVYDTEPVGLVLEQPEFLNACLEIETELEPLALLDVCKRVERVVGRTEGVRHGPRVIDVDVLLLGQDELRHERLNLPHEDLANRRFVLVPLLELAPDLTLPDGQVLRDSLAALPAGQAVRRAGPPLTLS